MIDFGVVLPGETLYIPFDSYDGATGASEAISGLAVTDIEIFKNGSATQRASDNGYSLLDTDGIDIDSIVGLNGFSVNLADNSDAGFYTAGGRYWVVVASVTADGQTVNFTAATFKIGHPQAIVNTTIATLASQTSFTLTAGSADDNAYVGCGVYVHDIASAIQCCMGTISAYTGSTKTVTLAADPGVFTMAAGDNIMILPRTNVYSVGGTAQTARDVGANCDVATSTRLAPTVAARTLDVTATGAAGVDWGNVENPTSTVGLTGTTVATTQKVDVETIKTQAVTCAAGVTVLASVGTASASTAQTGDVGSLITTVGSAGAGLTSIPNSAGVATLLSRVPDTISLAAINAEVDTALDTAIPGSPTSNSINERVKAIDDKLPAGSIGDATAANQATIIAKTDLIPASPAAVGDIPTAAAIKTALEADGSKLDHLWETTEDDAGVRRFTANALEQSPAGSAPTAVQIRQEMDSNSTQLAAIVADTEELQTRFNNMIEADGADWRFVTNALENSPTGTGGFTSGDRTTIEDTKTLVQALL